MVFSLKFFIQHDFNQKTLPKGVRVLLERPMRLYGMHLLVAFQLSIYSSFKNRNVCFLDVQET